MRRDIYNNQLNMARQKLNETVMTMPRSSATRTKEETMIETKPVRNRKQEPESAWQATQDKMDLASLGAAGVALIPTPASPVAELSSTAIDLANAGIYGARSVGELVSGNYAKAGEHALSAALRTAFAIPYLGTALQGGKAAHAATTAAKSARSAEKASVGLEVKPFKTPSKTLPVKSPSEVEVKPFKITPSTSPLPATKTVTQIQPKPISTAKTIAKTAAGSSLLTYAATKSIPGENTPSIPGQNTPKTSTLPNPNWRPRVEDEHGNVEKADIGLNLHSLSISSPGEASGYSRSQISQRRHSGQQYDTYDDNSWLLNRRRSSFAISHGLPESTDHTAMFMRMKNSLRNYLNSSI